MATHERELTGPVDLCLANGRRLNPAARGWSRKPWHRANLRGGWGRTKRWDYWCILAGDLAVAVTYADVDYLGMATVWWVDLATGRTGGPECTVPGARGIALPEQPGTEPLRYRSKQLNLDLVDDAATTTISADWTEPHGAPGRFHVRIDRPEDHESVNVVIPWSESRFQFTSKQQALPARGYLVVGGIERPIGKNDSAWAVLDVGRGRWPYRTRWNWGGGAGPATDGRVVGLQFGARWTEGTGFTENGVVVDGRVTKIGDELEWRYDWDRPTDPWRVRHPDGTLDVTLRPRFDRHARVNALVLATEVHQVFGTWSGHVTTDDGDRIHLDGLVGFAEESRSRW